MPNPENLKPFKKGKDPRREGNGRKVGSVSLLGLLKKKINECPEGEDKKTYAQLIIDRMMNDSIKKGDIQHIKTIWAYIEGQPKETKDVNVNLPDPLTDLTKLNEICDNNSDKENSTDERENKGSAGGDICVKDNINSNLLNLSRSK